jgi:probable selenium-dependent hydroxylase accessory protein YqeC
LEVGSGDVVAFIGAGGKTSVLRCLAAEFCAARRRVLLLSTTKIEAQRGQIETRLCAALAEARAVARARQPGDAPLLIATEQLPTRLRGVPVDWVAELAQFADVTLVQADGAGRRPFKAPAPHEPVVPPCATLVVSVAGIDAIGQPVDERHVHRPEQVAALGGVTMGDPLTLAAAARVLAHPDGGFRATPQGARRAVLINKVDNDARLEQAGRLSDLFRQRLPIAVIATSFRMADPVRALWRPPP